MIERIDVAMLLEPFADRPCGGDVREGGPGSDRYLELKDARAAARIAERAASEAETGTDPLRAGVVAWSTLADGAFELLSGTTKDVEIAAWLTEALLRLGGIAGLADGFALTGGLIERFWTDGLWPAADEDGDETRLAALFGLFGRGGTGTLLQPLKLIALSDRGDVPVTLSSAELAVAPAPPRTSDEEAQALIDERRNAALDAVRNGIGQSSRPFLIDLRGDLVRAAANLEALMQAIDRVSDVGRFGSQIAAPLSAAIKLLDDHAATAFIDSAVPEQVVAEDADGAAPATSVAAPRSVPGSRTEALASILSLADYFEQREPQSPIGPALREVARRARMPFEALLSELLPDAASRTLFLQRAGIRAVFAETGEID